MKSVLTLLAPPDKQKLTADIVAQVAGRMAQDGARVFNTDALGGEAACDIAFAGMEPAAAEESARAELGDLLVDCVAQETDARQKRFLIADMDSTMITVECIDEIADFAGVRDRVATITARAMRGEVDFNAALEERVMLLKDLSVTTLERVWDERVKFTPGGRELVATMKESGAYTLLVSGGFDFFTSRVREALGFDADVSNRLEVANGKLTGRVIPPILGKGAKLQALLKTCMERGISREDVLAVGDGANDIPMLVAAGLGVAVHAKPLVQQSVRARINHCDLTALLYVQGYRTGEIIGAEGLRG